MKYIRAICRTNLDDYDCNMVTKFVALPRIGDRVIVSRKGNAASLKVVGVTHDQRADEPVIIVELNN